MKRISIFLMALAVLATLSQCKKEKEVLPNNDTEAVTITLNVKGNNNAKAEVNPATGAISFAIGDSIIVANNSKFVGWLTYTEGGCFTGTISDAVEDQPLHFYYLGNVNPIEELSPGNTTSCSVVISDQTEHLPVISYGVSVENFETTRASYTACLLNKCGLVKFDVYSLANNSAAIIVKGLNNKVTVDFGQNTFQYGKDGVNDYVKLSGGSGEKWAILLPQPALEAGTMGTAYSLDNEYTGTRGAIPAIHENSLLKAGISVTVNTLSGNYTAPTGAIKGQFTVNSSGKKVYFSQGNLQYQASTNTWRFAENQCDCVGSANSNISQTYSGWIDLFGWGTSGYNHNNACYQPWSTSTNDADYYAYGEYNNNLYDGNGKADWGYNKISNGGNQENLWRCLTYNEWVHITNNRDVVSGIHYAKAMVNNMNGLILLPDSWNVTIYPLNGCDDYSTSYSSNVINDPAEWTTMEANGAVFLPAAGSRSNTSISNVGSTGYYRLSNAPQFTCVYFNTNSSNNLGNRSTGYSVRLVQEVTNTNN